MMPPCKNCDKRQLGCHMTCADYLAYNDQQEKIRHQRYIDRMLGEIKDDQFHEKGNNTMKRFFRRMKDAKNDNN